jgi:transcriptional regulator with XRE-family HTH domain
MMRKHKADKNVANTDRPRESRANELDAHVGGRMRLRRTLLGLSQEKLAGALGITFQQVQKYERGINRVGASRLYDLSRILDVPVSFFFDGVASGKIVPKKRLAPKIMGVASPKASYVLEDEDGNDREVLELMRAFKAIKNPEMRKSVLDMVRSLQKKD